MTIWTGSWKHIGALQQALRCGGPLNVTLHCHKIFPVFKIYYTAILHLTNWDTWLSDLLEFPTRYNGDYEIKHILWLILLKLFFKACMHLINLVIQRVKTCAELTGKLLQPKVPYEARNVYEHWNPFLLILII